MGSSIVQYRYLVQRLPDLLSAFSITMQAALLGALLAVLWGLLLTIPRMSPNALFRRPALAYIAFVRYTPLLIQIYLLYFGLSLLGVRISALWCGVLAIMLQHGAFLAEVFRGAILAVPKGQWAGGRSVGLLDYQVAVRIILPQAFYKAMAPLGNQVIYLAKDTSLLAAIGVAELTLTAKMIAERSASTAGIFLAISIMYLFITTALGLAARLLESRMKPKV